jgi:hypothetical protein
MEAPNKVSSGLVLSSNSRRAAHTKTMPQRNRHYLFVQSRPEIVPHNLRARLIGIEVNWVLAILVTQMKHSERNTLYIQLSHNDLPVRYMGSCNQQEGIWLYFSDNRNGPIGDGGAKGLEPVFLHESIGLDLSEEIYEGARAFRTYALLSQGVPGLNAMWLAL